MVVTMQVAVVEVRITMVLMYLPVPVVLAVVAEALEQKMVLQQAQ
jgi:hypothetical protein